MSKVWNVYAQISGGQFIGQVEADTKEQAQELADKLEVDTSLCWSCAAKIEDPEVTEIIS